MTIEINQKAPDFTINATGNQDISLSQFLGQKVVLYFYPKDNTSGCISEGKDFRDYYSKFIQHNAVVLGVSRDSIKSHENFKEKHQFPFELLSDKDETLCKLYDVIKLKKLYGKEHMGIERSTFIINETGILVKEWRKVKVKQHVEEVIQALETL